jgi:anti-sigma factor (TIGR02949 family)
VERVISCGAAVERLWAFLDHELDHDDSRAVDAHLAFCRRCCGELEFAKHLRRLLRTTGSGDLPAGARARLDRFIEELADPAGGGDPA